MSGVLDVLWRGVSLYAAVVVLVTHAGVALCLCYVVY
jgi:hypothetical protein